MRGIGTSVFHVAVHVRVRVHVSDQEGWRRSDPESLEDCPGTLGGMGVTLGHRVLVVACRVHPGGERVRGRLQRTIRMGGQRTKQRGRRRRRNHRSRRRRRRGQWPVPARSQEVREKPAGLELGHQSLRARGGIGTVGGQGEQDPKGVFVGKPPFVGDHPVEDAQGGLQLAALAVGGLGAARGRRFVGTADRIPGLFPLGRQLSEELVKG
mmetsp:Transcript_19803/g.46142  ORF Transcript_19803/g.46142 Transcript_19803/m.46142 type:complete len:210 (+) Transcript_19803:1374-2003(+)